MSDYNIGDIITDYNGNKYKVITAGNKPTIPFIPNNIVNNDIVWGDIHLRKWGGLI